ncbi:medium-chain acyl-CoA ligase ACSF2, mitochondrial-like [Arctopsyche grandis]|uniref:medium-chain acyl-CoA ligase ACSF2, mitochondrial-like n=1 Tax=Arctopsyche grandis TaxID=121162 RepID=UPI00406D8106
MKKIQWSPPVLNSYVHNVGPRPLQNSTIGEALTKAANTWPGNQLIISEYENKSLTFEETVLEVRICKIKYMNMYIFVCKIQHITILKADKLASGLLKYGLKPNDRIGVCSPNSARYLVTMMAASRIGLILVAINPANQIRELKYCLNKVGVKALVIPSNTKTQNFYNMLRIMMPEFGQCAPGELNSSSVPSLRAVITMDDTKLDGVLKYKDIMAMGNGNEISSLQSTIRPDSSYAILFTSGTTGLPKAALQSHFNYMNNSMDVGYRIELDKKFHNICLQLPFFHAFGLLLFLASIQHGSTLIIPSATFKADDTIKTIAKHKCTALTGTPTMYVDMLKRRQERGIILDSPEMAITGGAPCSPKLFNKITQDFGVSHIRSVYGMTEVLTAFQSMPSEDMYCTTETVGRLMENLEAKVVDEEGKLVPMGTPGELCIRGYANMTGYWGDKTNNVISKENWLKTGDQFILEENGYGRIAGRIKDIIIRGGENILPKEIEDFLNTHPDVLETQVFGIKDDRLGEEICASVRVKQGSVFDYNQLKMYCKGTIAHFKVPKYLKIVDDFPKTASGKIQKFKLKEMVESGTL